GRRGGARLPRPPAGLAPGRVHVRVLPEHHRGGARHHLLGEPAPPPAAVQHEKPASRPAGWMVTAHMASDRAGSDRAGSTMARTGSSSSGSVLDDAEPLAEVIRGDLVESVHLGHLVVL